jgi:acyl-coenzyme A thioesterase PaaI-like protein
MEPDQAYFQAIPWCAELLRNPEFIITATDSRQYKESTEDALFGKTLKTDDTIRACLTFYKRPASGAPARIEEANTLLSLDYGVNGWPHVAHGGMVATIMDEAMGTLTTLNRPLGFISGPIVTASLNITYLKPVATPQIVLVSVRLREVQGRKYFIDSMVRDGTGTVLAKAEAVWVRPKQSGEKL